MALPAATHAQAGSRSVNPTRDDFYNITTLTHFEVLKMTLKHISGLILISLRLQPPYYISEVALVSQAMLDEMKVPYLCTRVIHEMYVPFNCEA